jgi:hypothetical protein
MKVKTLIQGLTPSKLGGLGFEPQEDFPVWRVSKRLSYRELIERTASFHDKRLDTH